MSAETTQTAAAPAAHPISGEVITEGDYVILCVNDKDFYFVQVASTGSLKINKRCKVPKKALLGAPYSAVFEAQNGSLTRIAKKPTLEEFVESSEDADNRNLVDTGTAQALSAEEIEEMKKSGVEGTKIIKALVEKSASFKQKTEFSQQKYLKKKQQRYGLHLLHTLHCSLLTYPSHQLIVTLMKPSTHSIANALYKIHPKKIQCVLPQSLPTH